MAVYEARGLGAWKSHSPDPGSTQVLPNEVEDVDSPSGESLVSLRVFSGTLESRLSLHNGGKETREDRR